MITRISLIVTVFCLIAKAICDNETGNHFIAGPGSNQATIGLFPSFVIINLPNAGQCGGFIINANHVVTAGSCVLDANRNLLSTASISIRFGTILWTGPPTPLAVIRIYVHPLFNPFTFDNDIAVLRTVANIPIQEGPASTIQPSEINERIIQDGAPCTFVGMTNTSLHFITQPVMNRIECNSPQFFNNRMVPSQFCVGSSAVAGPCLRNLGGPLFCDQQVSGILSNGFACGTIPNSPGVYTQLRQFIPWIMQQFNRTDLTPAGSTPPPTFPLLSGQSTIVGYISLIALSVCGLIVLG